MNIQRCGNVNCNNYNPGFCGRTINYQSVIKANELASNLIESGQKLTGENKRKLLSEVQKVANYTLPSEGIMPLKLYNKIFVPFFDIECSKIKLFAKF